MVSLKHADAQQNTYARRVVMYSMRWRFICDTGTQQLSVQPRKHGPVHDADASLLPK